MTLREGEKGQASEVLDLTPLINLGLCCFDTFGYVFSSEKNITNKCAGSQLFISGCDPYYGQQSKVQLNHWLHFGSEPGKCKIWLIKQESSQSILYPQLYDVFLPACLHQQYICVYWQYDVIKHDMILCIQIMASVLLLLLVILHLVSAQVETNTKGFIETRSLFVFATATSNQANLDGSIYPFNFRRNFTLVPRVGLSIYTMDFQYSPKFSVKVTSDTSESSASLVITSSNRGANDQLYIMYIATDHDFMGVFMPGPLITFQLNQGLPAATQSFVFNFKQQISSNSQPSDIRLTVYLTGIVSTSELVANGYPNNQTYFSIAGTVLSSSKYQIDVAVKSQFGDVTISQVEYTIVYFDATVMINYRYQMDSGVVSLQNFGGTTDASSKSISINPLSPNANFSSLKGFYGVAVLDCRQGTNIVISTSYQIFTNPLTNATQIIVKMLTWRNTFVVLSSYNFIQYQSLNCNLPNSNCDANCETSPQPHYFIDGVCNYCQLTCLSCKSSVSCDSCDTTRQLSPTSNICLCKQGYYDNLTSYACSDCYPCKTCNIQGVCLSCQPALHLVLNQILNRCQCGPGFTPNYVDLGNQTLSRTTPCLGCFENCLQCLNQSYCLACNLITYLSNGQCHYICNSNEKYNEASNTCVQTEDVMYDQVGRLAYSWSYTADSSIMTIILTFSQANVMFYYYQNEIGYSQGYNGQFGSQMAKAEFYYDDGQNSAGFASSAASASQYSFTSLNSNANQIFGSANLTAASNFAISNFLLTGNIISSNALNGSYYGLGELQFYKYLYQHYIQTYGITNYYNDRYGIPCGKYNLSTNTAVVNPNFVDALSNNLVLTIGSDLIPFTVKANSNNQFTMTASVTKSYYGDDGSIILKNQGLARSGRTASVVWKVSAPVFIYYCTIPSYVASAKNIYDSNSIIVSVLWGLSKYPLFVGFGWMFMPLMLVMQFIMSINYINTIKPLNLELFLKSFADFRNPSIFYNPLRNQIDNKIVNHDQIYTVIPSYYIFDRGIDFMKNCFEFFFVPFLSFVLFLLLYGFNKLLNVSSHKDIPLISEYLAQRLPLQLAAYVLVQALPVSFFFFAQLNDTRFSGPNQPSTSYPIFNVAMAYGAFFLTCAIPLVLMAYIHSIYTAKGHQVNSAKQFKVLFTNMLQALPQDQHKAGLDNPLWTSDPKRIISYGFGISVFFLAILYGFFTSFFIDSYPWQFTGLIIVTAAFLAFTAMGDQFQSRFIKYFWIIFAALMIAFLLLLAGIGSNVSSAPCDQEGIGYLGIGFLYLMILASLVACGAFIWLTGFELYQNYFEQRPIVVNLDEKIESQLGEPPERIKTIQLSNKLNSGYLRNPSQFAMGRSKMNIGGDSLKQGEQDLPSQQRMIMMRAIGDVVKDELPVRHKLRFLRIDEETGEYIYELQNGKRTFKFDGKNGRSLRDKEPIYIDSKNQVYNCNLINVGNYVDLHQKTVDNLRRSFPGVDVNPPPSLQILPQPENLGEINEENESVKISQDNYKQKGGQKGQYQQYQNDSDAIPEVVQVKGEEYVKMGESEDGKLILRNRRTGVIKYFHSTDLDRQQNSAYSKNTLINKLVPVSAQIEKNQVELKRGRKIRVDNQEFVDMGQNNDYFILYNPNTKQEMKVNKQQYLQMNLQSFNNRINIDGIDYDYDGTGMDQSVRLIDTYTRKPRVVTQNQFIKLKQQNEQKLRLMYNSDFKDNLQNALSKSFQQINTNSRRQVPGNILLLQSKASVAYSAYTETISQKFTQNEVVKVQQDMSMGRYSSQGHKQVVYQQEHELVESEDFTISKLIESSPGPGPFKLCVVPKEKVFSHEDQQDQAQQTYKQEDVVQMKVLNSREFDEYMKTVEKRFPGSVAFVTDMSNRHEYIL